MSVSQLTIGVALVLVALGVVGRSAWAAESPQDDARAQRFIQQYEATVRPLEIEVNRLWWTANLSGKDEDYQKKEEAESRLDAQLSNPKTFAELKAIKESRLSDPRTSRQIAVLYLEYLAKQVSPELLKAMVAKSNAVEKAFNVYRAKVGGKEMTDNEVRDVLRHSSDSARLRAVWEASKAVGPIIAPQLKELVKLRNESARQLGFANYHVMALYLNEQSQQQVLQLFDELDALTRGPFHAAKGEIDAALAKQYGIGVDELRPWHYHDPFFQESPEVFGENNDAVYAAIDIPKACREFYAGIGLPVDDVLARSDLYEKPGKNPHAFCTDIDRQGDVRVLANIVPDKQWFSTMLHELGHSVYSSKNIPPSMPYALRCESHILTTEGVAMMFERFAGNADWLKAMNINVPDAKKFNTAAAKVRRNHLLIFSRWCQVMLRFEKELYGNPDQDLGRLWWQLVQKYQELTPPAARDEPDYASKIHIIVAPVYYHNYLMGELFAAQVHRAIAREVLGGVDPAGAIYVGNKAVGRFMIDRVFAPGRSLNWNDLARHATGEKLNAQAFAAELGNP